MASSVEQALTGLVRVFTMAKRPEPFPGSLGSYKPHIDGLQRDEQNIVMQLSEGRLDGGDSSHRTGVLAFCDSEMDRDNLRRFQIAPGLMTRHPTQAPWNNPKNCSRDQLLGYISGCWRWGYTDLVNNLLEAHANRMPPFTCQNTERDYPGSTKTPPLGDLLAPHEIMYFRICSGDFSASLDLPAQLSLYLAIMTTPTSVDAELNQLLLMSTVCGQLDIFVQQHPNYREALHNYWSGEPWRGQHSIAESLIDVVNLESARYSPISLLDALLPKHLLEEFQQLNLGEELKAFQSGNPLQFAQLSARFIVATLRDIGDHIEMLVRSLNTLAEAEKLVVGAVIVALRSAAKDAFGKFTQLVNDSHLDPTGITTAALGIAASVLGLGASGDSAEERQFREQTTLALNTITKNTEQTLKALGKLQTTMEQKFAEIAVLIKQEFYDLVLNELLGGIQNANVLLDRHLNNDLDPELRNRLLASVDGLRTLIIRVAKSGPATLGYCFQAYGVVVTLLNAAGHGVDEIAATRKAFAQFPFKALLEAPAGAADQLLKLRDVEDNETKMFEAMRSECLVGVSSVEQERLYYPPGKGEPVSVGTHKWDITGYVLRIDGEIDQAALVTGKLEAKSLGVASAAITNVAALKSFIASMTIAEEIGFIEARVGFPSTGSLEKIQAKGTARIMRARLASQHYVDARRVIPEVEALTTAVKATFGI